MCSSLFGSLLALALVATIGLVAARDHRDGRIDALSWSVVLAPLCYPAFGVLTLRAILEYGLSWDGSWYHVEKTGS